MLSRITCAEIAFSSAARSGVAVSERVIGTPRCSKPTTTFRFHSPDCGLCSQSARCRLGVSLRTARSVYGSRGVSRFLGASASAVAALLAR
ncbi:hypothetical protein [Lysobacter gummosus]|uniref:hypothetical protein n=1 Tax=Lysobacter gummosus TaxID=262324 RepID=UPI00363B6E03